MTNKAALLFVSDLIASREARLFIIAGEEVIEVSPKEVVSREEDLICHDFWSIARFLYMSTGHLPRTITDVDDLRVSTTGRKDDRKLRDQIDVCKLLLKLEYISGEVARKYRGILGGSEAICSEVLLSVGTALLRYSNYLEERAKAAGEWTRYCELERPVSNYLNVSAARGISVDTEALRMHKKSIEHAYFMALKLFSAKYEFPLEVPSDDDVKKYLSERGYDFSEIGIDYVIRLLPTPDGFSDRLLELRKIAASRRVLDMIPMSQNRLYPIVDTFGTITSRIYYRDPSLQNLARRYRSIIAADPGKILSYVDYGQYEAGIMGALSDDRAMIDLFSSGDVYSQVASGLFACDSKRKAAKRLFLSYAYGMKRSGVIDSACAFGAKRDAAKSFFNQFRRFEEWRKEIHFEFRENCRIGTQCGNFLL